MDISKSISFLQITDGTTTISTITNATSTATGALQVKGGVGIGKDTFIGGSLYVLNEITAYYTSDQKFKENLQIIENPITLINQINGYYFDWKDSYLEKHRGEDGYFIRKNDVGVIAQEIEVILPQVVATRVDGTKAVRYEKIIPLLIESIKELSKEIDQLKKKL